MLAEVKGVDQDDIKICFYLTDKNINHLVDYTAMDKIHQDE